MLVTYILFFSNDVFKNFIFRVIESHDCVVIHSFNNPWENTFENTVA